MNRELYICASSEAVAQTSLGMLASAGGVSCGDEATLVPEGGSAAMLEKAAILFGAGATRALGGPMTDEILPHVLGTSACSLCATPPGDEATGGTERCEVSHGSQRNKTAYGVADGFLRAAFNVPDSPTKRAPDDYPSLPLLMTLLDQGVATGDPVGRAADQSNSLEDVRHALLTIIYDAIVQEAEQGRVKWVLDPNRNPYWLTLRQVLRDLGEPDDHPTLYEALRSGRIVTLTTNYDTYLENTLFAIQAAADKEILPPHYGCKPHYEASLPPTHFERKEPTFGYVWKLHGSIAWAFCRDCGLLHDRFTPIGKEILKALKSRQYPTSIEPRATDAQTFLMPDEKKGREEQQRSAPANAGCADCHAPLSPFMIAPSLLKNYRNDHLCRVWSRAVRGLREAQRWYFIGYSLPDDDYEIAKLLLRAARYRVPSERNPSVVVQKGAGAASVGSRFRRLLGEPRVFADGCAAWAKAPTELPLPTRFGGP